MLAREVCMKCRRAVVDRENDQRSLSGTLMAAAVKRYSVFPIGTPGVAWGEAEKAAWRAQQVKQRDYFRDVVSALHRLGAGGSEGPAVPVDVEQYGELDYRRFGAARYPLFAAKSAPWDPAKPMVAITGGVHGYESSGIHGALTFLRRYMAGSAALGVNVLVLPCVSPWGYEMIHRWTPEAVDPNRQFKPDAAPGCDEARFAMACIAAHVAKSQSLLLHMDLHETTDTDNTVFTPSRFARDGLTEDKFDAWYDIPDGFYVYGDSARPVDQLEFSNHLIAEVGKVTHIAPADADGKIVGEKVAAPGVLLAPGEGTADAHTKARFVTTTEVYPDSARTNPEECNVAQATAVKAGIEYVVAHRE